jgi:hypothetical protein
VTRENGGTWRTLTVYHEFSVTMVALEKEITIIYSESVFIALGIMHSMRMRHIAICDLSGRKSFST